MFIMSPLKLTQNHIVISTYDLIIIILFLVTTQDEVETAESSSVVVGGAIDEPFSSHYDRVLEESDAVSLKELYSQPLTLNKEQVMYSLINCVSYTSKPHP